MSIRSPLLAARAIAVAGSILLLAAPLTAQGSAKSPSDSSWIVQRVPLSRAVSSLRTRDSQAAVLLMDTTLVLQFTDEGLARMNAGIRDSAPQELGARIFARMIGSALGELFDHGIAYDLRGLRSARVEGNRLVLENLAGKRVFDHVEVNGRNVMDDFPAAEAARFAAAVNRAIRH